MNHEAITKIITADGTIPYGHGITPNPLAGSCVEWARRKAQAEMRQLLTLKIESLFEPRFITPPETAECIEALVTMTDSRRILEVGTCTGFTSLHILRAIVGKAGAKLTSIDARPAHDAEFFAQIAQFEHLAEWTPACLEKLKPRRFQFVFVDSDHSLEHTQREMAALFEITDAGSIFCFHDLPAWQTPGNRQPVPVRVWLEEQVRNATMRGLVLPTAEQLDCVDAYGAGYPWQCSPHLGVFIRN